jgi:hypothetical protein
MLQHEFSGSRGGMATGGGWFAITAGMKPCQRCGYGPAIACLPGALYECICATCARLGGCSEEIIAEGVSAHSPLAPGPQLAHSELLPAHVPGPLVPGVRVMNTHILPSLQPVRMSISCGRRR